MLAHFLPEALLGLGPVILFLAALLYLDSFKLVGFGSVVGVVLMGALAAVASYFAAGGVMDAGHMDLSHYSRFVAPFVEEGFKAAILVWLFARNRVGFMVDAAIMGLAVGAGFSIFENIYYATIFPEANMGIWLVRGLGTAIMHGGVSALFAVTAQALRERHDETGVLGFVPGYLLAVSIHSIFNQFTGYPLQSAAGTVILLPLALFLVFDKSEHEVHDWLVHDYETHQHLLDDIRSGKFAHSKAGQFITGLSKRFSDAVVADVFAYIKLHTKLVLRAEKLLLAKERGEREKIDASDAESFAKLHALEKRIGRTALLAIWPHLKFSRQELFEVHQLEAKAA